VVFFFAVISFDTHATNMAAAFQASRLIRSISLIKEHDDIYRSVLSVILKDLYKKRETETREKSDHAFISHAPPIEPEKSRLRLE